MTSFNPQAIEAVPKGKSALTLQLEREIWEATSKMGVFGCHEVTIGWFGKQRVDYMTYDTKGIWRCYEIKVSKSDFHSKADHTFVGHYNYYVMPKDLFEQVKDEIPLHIGVYYDRGCSKKPKKQELGVDEQVLKDSMIRSLCREFNKKMYSESDQCFERTQRELREERRQREKYQNEYWKLQTKIYKLYGENWDKGASDGIRPTGHRNDAGGV